MTDHADTIRRLEEWLGGEPSYLRDPQQVRSDVRVLLAERQQAIDALREALDLTTRMEAGKQQPVDFNYVAVYAQAWEDLLAILDRAALLSLGEQP